MNLHFSQLPYMEFLPLSVYRNTFYPKASVFLKKYEICQVMSIHQILLTTQKCVPGCIFVSRNVSHLSCYIKQPVLLCFVVYLKMSPCKRYLVSPQPLVRTHPFAEGCQAQLDIKVSKE